MLAQGPSSSCSGQLVKLATCGANRANLYQRPYAASAQCSCQVYQLFLEKQSHT